MTLVLVLDIKWVVFFFENHKLRQKFRFILKLFWSISFQIFSWESLPSLTRVQVWIHYFFLVRILLLLFLTQNFRGLHYLENLNFLEPIMLSKLWFIFRGWLGFHNNLVFGLYCRLFLPVKLWVQNKQRLNIELIYLLFFFILKYFLDFDPFFLCLLSRRFQVAIANLNFFFI